MGALNHLAQPIDDSVMFSPAWMDGTSEFDTVAYAGYSFDLTAREGRPVLNWVWQLGPGKPEYFWIGISNWQKDGWDWYNGPSTGKLQLAVDSLDKYRHPQSDEMYVIVLMIGQQNTLLDRIWINGFSLRGDWYQYGRDYTRTNCSPYPGPDYPGLQWEHNFGTGAMGSPPVYDATGAAYVGVMWDGADNVFQYAMNADGTQRWFEQMFWGPPTGSIGISSSALNQDGVVLSGIANYGLYAFTRDGDTGWLFVGLMAMAPSLRHPVFGPDNTIYAISSEEHSSLGRHLYALNVDTTQKWLFTNVNGELTEPAIGSDGNLYCGAADNNLYCISADGVQAWGYTSSGPITIAPAVAPNGTILFSNAENKVYAVLPDGTLDWAFDAPAALRTPLAVGKDSAVYFSVADGTIQALNADGTSRWSYATAGQVSFLSIDSEDTVYAACDDARLYAITADGDTKWWFDTPYAVKHPPVIGEEGSLYLMDSGGTLYLVGTGNEMDDFSASGDVVDGSNAAMQGVQVSVSGHEPVYTDADGHWIVEGLPAGNYLVSPFKSGVTFSPSFAILTITDADVIMSDFVGSASTTPAWQMWGNNSRRTHRSEFTGPADETVKWFTQYPSESFLEEPVIDSAGTIYFQSVSGALYAFAPDGTELWHSSGIAGGFTPALGLDGACYSVASSPHDGNRLVAIGPAGNVLWTNKAVNFGPPAGLAASGSVLAAMEDGICQVSTLGAVDWSYLIPGATTNALAVDDAGKIYSSNCQDKAIALNPDGSLSWEVNLATTYSDQTHTAYSAVGDDGAIYIVIGTHVYALEPDGAERWHYTTTGVNFGPPAVSADGKVYVVLDGGEAERAKNAVYALRNDGTQAWTYGLMGFPFSPVVVLDAAGCVYAGVKEMGTLHVVNPDGTLKYLYDTNRDITGVAIGTDGTAYFGNKLGDIFALGPAS